MKDDNISYRNLDNFNDRFDSHDDGEDDISDFREQRQRKFDVRASKKARQGRHESRKKDKGFQRLSKEDRQNRF